MTHFFISYAKKDTRELALALSDALNALPNVTAWVDRSLKAGQSWESQIQREINKCDYFVVLYSPDLNRHLADEALSESYVLTEIAYAKYTLKKPIIPVMAQETIAPLSLTTLHYIDFTIKGLSLDDLLEAICDEAGILLQNNAPVGTVSIPSVTPKPKTKPSSLDLMPQPFAWIEIPNKGYSMAKYPITNLQFAEFVKAGGYTEQKWWTKIGWEEKLKGWDWDTNQKEWIETGKAWIEPRHWRESQFNGDEQPVVGVSWYETLAFCLWLSDMTGEKIMLPTEEQWQYAAQGDDGRIYPWGNDWDSSRSRNSVGGSLGSIGNTSPVRQYEGKDKGDSPFGVTDMAGNVLEWCLTEYNNTDDFTINTIFRVLRGGSWLNFDSYSFRCDYRSWSDPHSWLSQVGFRISRFNLGF